VPNITLTGEEYHGSDGDTPLDLYPGDVVEVSEAKLEQLLADFPGRFKKGGRKPASNAPSNRPPAGPILEPYADIQGDELRALAAQRDIEFADDATDDEIRGALRDVAELTGGDES